MVYKNGLDIFTSELDDLIMIRRYASLFVLLFTLTTFISARCAEPEKITFKKGDSVAIMGEGVADRLQHDGWLETLIQKAFPQDELVIRNIAFSGDEVVSRERTETGATREEWLQRLKADVILAFYGTNESFAGPAGIEKFKQELDGFLKEKAKANYSGKGAPRVVLFSPIAQEKINDPNVADPAIANKNLALYTAAMAEVAAANNVRFVDLFNPSLQLYPLTQKPLTFNGFQMTVAGNEALAPVIFKGAINAELPSPSGALMRCVRP